MPFPLSSLPYGFRQRLRELATPIEALQLQTAAPHFCGFQPLVSLNSSGYNRQFIVNRLKSDTHFFCHGISGNQLIPLTDNELYHGGELWLLNLRSVDKALSILDHYLLSPCGRLKFSRMHISLALVEKVKSNLTIKMVNYNHDEHPYRELCFSMCTFDSEAIPVIYRTLFKHFDSISWLSFKEVTWLQDMMNENVSGLQSLCVKFDSPKLLNVDKILFAKFCQAQAPDFEFFVRTPGPCSDPLFKKQFNTLMSGNFAKVSDNRCRLKSARTVKLKEFHGFDPPVYTTFELLSDV